MPDLFDLGQRQPAIFRQRRPREAQFNDVLGAMKSALGKVAQRTLMAGSGLRNSAVQREEVGGRGARVTIAHEARGIATSQRGRANEAGAVGDVISITNPQSKRVLQGTVTGPGRVNVSPQGGGQIAAAR
mgnify:CR=1 FL=1